MIQKKYILFPFIYTISIFILAIFIIKINYTAGDDTVMQMMLNGAFTNGDLNIYSVFNNIIFSSCIGFLYHIFPKVEWYPLVLLSLISFSTFILSYLIQINSKGAKKIGLFFILTFSVWFLAKLQFTSVTGFTTLTGYFLLLNSENKKIHLYIAFIFLFIASLIRFEMFMLVSFCVLPHIIFDDFRKQKLFFLILLFLTVSLSVGINHHFYHAEDWAYYTHFNELRGRLNDNPNFTPNTLSKVLNERDVNLYLLFIYPESIDLQSLKTLWNYTKGDLGKNLLLQYTFEQYKPIIILSIILTIGNYLSKKYFLILFVFIFWGFIYYITINHLAKERIVYPTIFFYTILSIYHLHIRHKYFSYIIALFIIYKHIDIYKQHETIKFNNKFYAEIEKHKDNVYIPLPTSGHIILSLDPFAKRMPYNIIISGWPTNSPLLKNRKDINYAQNIFDITPKKGKSIVYIATKKDFEVLSPLFYKDTFSIIKIIDDAIFFIKNTNSTSE